MNADQLIQQIDEKILEIKKQLLSLEPMHPGSVSNQYKACGKPGCKCQDPQKKSLHGPYCKLSFVHHGKFACRFVRADQVTEITALLANYKTFRQLTDQWVALSIERAKLGPLAPSKSRASAENTKTSEKQKRQS